MRARAAGLTVLLCISGWLLTFAVAYGLDALGLHPGKLSTGGGSAGAGVVVVIGALLLLVYVGALVVAVIVAVVREKRSARAWHNAASSAAFGVAAPSLILLYDGPNANALLSIAIPGGLLLFVSRLDVQKPWRAALAVPGLAVIAAFVTSTVLTSARLGRDREDELIHAVERAAEAADTKELQAALDALPSDGRNLDGVLSYLPMRGERRAEVEQILRHPKTEQTRCVNLLRAAMAGEVGQWRANAGGDSCRVAGAHFAARQGSPEIVAAAAISIDSANERINVLGQLISVKDEAAALRWISAAGMTNDAGVIRSEVMTFDFIVAMYRGDERGFYWKHSDVDALLVAICGNDAHEYRVIEALDAGAHVNARTGCGTTPLISICTGHELNTSAIGLLLDAGADPNLPGTRFCIEGEPAAPLETPLWHLVKRRNDWNNLPHHAIELLIDRGAETTRRSSDGGSLFDEASEDQDVLNSLRHFKQ